MALTAIATQLLMAPSAMATVKLSPLFSDGCILQKDKTIYIFGNALPGEVVEAEINGLKEKVVTSSKGRFLIAMPPLLKPGGPYNLRVKGQNEIIIKDIYLGEVWLLLGDNAADGTPDVKKQAPKTSQNNLVRVFHVKENLSQTLQRQTTGTWQNVGSSRPGFANLIASKLGDNLSGAVGVIDARFPRMPVKSWLSPQAFEEKIDHRNIYQKYAITEDKYKEATTEWQEKNQDLLQIPEALREAASLTYNGTVGPVTPFSLRGAIWTEGGIDIKSAGDYTTLFPLIIKDVRSKFKQEQLPFITIQLGQIEDNGSLMKDKNSPAALLRQAQYKSRLIPKNTLVVTADLDDPYAKQRKGDYEIAQQVADRTIDAILATEYKKQKPYRGPVFQYAEPNAEKLKLYFGDTQGLLRSRDGDFVMGFELAGLDHNFQPAKAVITGNTITLSNELVKKPLYARYAWTTNPRLGVFNKVDLPLSPFDSDR